MMKPDCSLSHTLGCPGKQMAITVDVGITAQHLSICPVNTDYLLVDFVLSMFDAQPVFPRHPWQAIELQSIRATC